MAWKPLILVAVAMTFLAVAAFDTEWEESFSFECPGEQSLVTLYSENDDRREDRRWRFGCATIVRGERFSQCSWSGYVNDYDSIFDFWCPNQGVLTGVESTYSDANGDRRYSFKCCSERGYATRRCYRTGYINYFDCTLNYTVPAGKYIAGVNSYHRNQREDRRFKLRICDLVGPRY